MTCDDYQIAFDQQAAGARTAVPAADVDAHVATCAACAAYATLSRKVATSMTNTLTLAPPALDLDAMRAGINAFRRQAKRGLLIWPAMFGAVFLVNRVVGLWPGTMISALVSTAIATGLAYAFLAYRVRRYISGLTALAAKSGDELVAGVRAELERRIRNERQGWWVLPIVLALFHWRFVGLALPSQPYVIAFEICCLAIVPIGIVRYRRAKRERALLG